MKLRMVLIKEDDPLNKMLKLAISYEKGQWENVMHYAKEIDIDASKMSEIYIEAVKWADNIYWDKEPLIKNIHMLTVKKKLLYVLIVSEYVR